MVMRLASRAQGVSLSLSLSSRTAGLRPGPGPRLGLGLGLGQASRLRPASRLGARLEHRNLVSTLQEQILLRSVNSVLLDLAIDEPTAWMPAPDFSDCERLRRRERKELRRGLLDGVADEDPFALVKADVAKLQGNIKNLLGSDHPVLETVAKYFFDQEGGKKMRPALVLLMAQATKAHADTEAALALSRAQAQAQAQAHPQAPASPEALAALEALEAATAAADPEASREREEKVYAAQMRLAEITEMIHTASLLHDDVIDVSDTRRGVKSVNQMFGNKLAILAGDFLLARASVCLARLRNLEVIEVLSTVIEHLVKGEVMQMKADLQGPEAFEYYLRKNYYKTGSLIANSAQASAILAGHPRDVQLLAFEFGESIGHAFQLVDDALDFEGSMQSLGKPALADLRQGLATAPVIFAQEEFPELQGMIGRKFSGADDVDRAAVCVSSSSSIAQTRELALAYAEKAIEAALKLHPSPARDALVRLALKVVHRSS